MSDTILELLAHRGLKAVKISEKHGGEYVSPCPKCGGFDHFHIWPALNPQGCKGGVWFCTVCGNSGDASRFIHIFGEQQPGTVVVDDVWSFLKSFPVVASEEATPEELRETIARMAEYVEVSGAEVARLRAQNKALLECRKAEKSLASLTRINEGIKGGWIKPWAHEGLSKKLRAARERVRAARQGLEAARMAVEGK